MKWKIFSRPVIRERELTMLFSLRLFQSHRNTEMATHQWWPRKESRMSSDPRVPVIPYFTYSTGGQRECGWQKSSKWPSRLPSGDRDSLGSVEKSGPGLWEHWCARLCPWAPLPGLFGLVCATQLQPAVTCSAAAIYSLDKLTHIWEPIYPELG